MVISESGLHLCLELDCTLLLSGFPDPDRFDFLPMGSSASFTSSLCAACGGANYDAAFECCREADLGAELATHQRFAL